MSILVSVIMAVHDEPRGILETALRSVLCQSLKNTEFIICDDGSGQPTAELLEHYAKEGKIVLLRNERSAGAGCARNRALAQAQGRYIAIMDADDISDKTRLEKELNFLQTHPDFAFVGCRGECFFDTPGDLRESYWFVKNPEPKDFLMTLPFVHASILFRKYALDTVSGYREIPRVTRSEDYDLLLRLYENGFRGANLNETLYYIRKNSETLRRRKYRYRFCEAAVKAEGFIKLGLMPIGIPYVLKPLIVGILPNRVLETIKRRYYSRRN